MTGGRRARRLLEQGQPAHGRITGIRVRDIGGSDDPVFVNEYAIEVEGNTTFTCGVRQRLVPSGLVRLGMEVATLFEGSEAVIDWRATCGGAVKSPVLISDVPEPGIDDRRLHPLRRARKRSTAARATIVGIDRREGVFGRRANWELEVRRDGVEPRRVTVQAGPPHYATHLGAIGTELPAWIGRWPRKPVMVDWPMAAMERPGIDEPPAEVFAWLDPEMGRLMGM